MSNLLRAAGAMGIATFFSRILGLVREQVFAILFGAGNATDAFYIAFRIPNLLRDLFAEGAMSAALIPTFTRVREEKGPRAAWRLAGLVFRVLFVLVTLIAAAGIFFSEELVTLYASSYREVPGKFELTVLMTQIMFPFFPLVALAAAYMGILNACGKFFLPAFASALFNFASIVTGVAFAFVMPRFGVEPIVGMAIGVVIGGAVQAFSQLPSLYRVGYRFPKFGPEDHPWHRHAALKQMLVMMIPGTIGLAATQINVLVNSILATSEGAGAVSWLNYAFRLMQFPIGVFGVSLAAATLPTLSKLWVNREYTQTAATLTQSLKMVFAVNLPASAGLAFLSVPIIELLFEYGRFSASDTQATAIALASYSIGLPAYSAVKVLVPACYALGNTKIAVVSSVISVVFTIALNLAMVGPFGYWGLALGTSLAAIVNASFLLVAVRRLIGRTEAKFLFFPLIRSFSLYLAVALAMGGLCWGSHEAMEISVSDFILEPALGLTGVILVRFLKVGLLIFEGVLLVVLLARVLGLREVQEAIELFTKKLKKKLSRSRN